MSTRDNEDIFVEVLAKGIVAMLEVLYDRAVRDELDQADQSLLYAMREVFHDFYKSDENSIDALRHAGIYRDKFIGHHGRMNDASVQSKEKCHRNRYKY